MPSLARARARGKKKTCVAHRNALPQGSARGDDDDDGSRPTAEKKTFPLHLLLPHACLPEAPATCNTQNHLQFVAKEKAHDADAGALRH